MWTTEQLCMRKLLTPQRTQRQFNHRLIRLESQFSRQAHVEINFAKKSSKSA